MSTSAGPAQPNLKQRLGSALGFAAVLGAVQGILLLLPWHSSDPNRIEHAPGIALGLAAAIGIVWGWVIPGLPKDEKNQIRPSGAGIFGYGLLPAFLSIQQVELDRPVRSSIFVAVATVVMAYALAWATRVMTGSAKKG